jgi:glycosyltransferase involved in cell wall biosynthesis
MENWLYHIIKQGNFYPIDLETIAPKGIGDPLYDLSSAIRYHHTAEGDLTCKTKGFLKKFELVFRFIVWSVVTSRLILYKQNESKEEKLLFIGIHTIPSMLPLLLAKLFNPRIKFIAYARGRVGDDLLRENHTILASLYLLIEKYALNRSEEVFSNGYDTTGYIAKLTKKRITTLPNGVDFFSLGHPKPLVDDKVLTTIKKLKADHYQIILCLGTVRPVKGVSYVLDAASHLRSHDPLLFERLMFVFVGKGDVTRYLTLGKKLNISNNVHFLGQSTNVPEVLALADVAMAVSGGGGFSNAAIEMMAARLPIVGWDSDTYSQLIQSGITGHLVPSLDAKSLAAGIKLLIEDSAYANLIAMNAQNEASKYDWSVIAKNFFNAAKGVFPS